MKKIKATLKAGERIMANTVDGKYMISNGAWLLPVSVVAFPPKLESLIAERKPFMATKDRIETERIVVFGKIWQPDEEIVGAMEDTKIITVDGNLLYRWLVCDTGGEMYPVDNDYYEAIKPWFPFWQGGIVNNSKVFYFSKGEGQEPAGKLMGLRDPYFSTQDLEYLKGFLAYAEMRET